MNYTKIQVTEDVQVFKIERDSNGNARYVVHYLALGVKPGDYNRVSIPGLTKYRAKWYSGGYVFQSVNLKFDLNWMMETVNRYYNAAQAH